MWGATSLTSGIPARTFSLCGWKPPAVVMLKGSDLPQAATYRRRSH